MKIRIKTDTHHRVSSGLSQAFKAGSEINVPKAIAEALVERGVAEVIGEKQSDKGE